MSYSWVDMFPWLNGWADGLPSSADDPQWIRASVFPLDDPGTERRKGAVADLILERMDSWTIGRLMPGLPSMSPLEIAPRQLSTRLSNNLKRHGYRTTSDLIDLEIRDLYSMRNVGAGTMRELVLTLIDTTIQEPPAPLPPTGNESLDADLDGPEAAEWILLTPQRSGIPGVQDDAAYELWSDLSKIARWNLLRGRGHESLWATLPDTEATPPEVIDAFDRMRELTANRLFPGSEGESVPLMLAERVRAFDEVDQAILRDRFAADDPATLDMLGRQAGVTRERIRQRESKAISQLDVLVSSSESLRWVMEAIRQRVGDLLSFAELIDYLPVVGELVPILEQPVWRVLDRLDPAYEIEGDWCAAPTVAQRREETVAELEDLASPNGVVRLDATSDLNVLTGLHEVPFWFSDWLLSCGLKIHRDHVLTRTGSLNDRAAAALEISGEPTTLVELPAFVAEGRSERSLANALAGDPRFVRVDRQRWALADWGVGEYTGIADAIRRQLDQAGGAMPMGQLVAALTARYDVAENSVRAYASGNPFSVANGIVSMAASSKTRRVSKTWQQTRRVYKRENTWLYRVTINREHMRGSGSPCPVALAVELDVPPGGERQFGGPMGTFGVHWPSLQPTLGSIGGLLRSVDAAVGDDVLLCFDEATVQAEIVAQSSIHPWVAAALLAGGRDDLDADQAHGYLAMAVGSSPEVGTADLMAALEARGDADLAQLVLNGVHATGARAPLNGSPMSAQAKTDVDDILDLL